MAFMEFLKFPARSTFPATGDNNRLYVDLQSKKIYYWDRGAYQIASPDIVEQGSNPISEALSFAGIVATVADLPAKGDRIGDVYIVEPDEGHEQNSSYVWSGTRWIKISDTSVSEDTTFDVDSKITAHDKSNTAHLPLRTLIDNLQREVDRVDGKGLSWGEVNKTLSELEAMDEPDRSDYINTFLAAAFAGYTPSNGDLVYTSVGETEERHELEYNSILSQWVDNGAYTVGKASNAQYGIVKGDSEYVSILNGIIQVLKSDYATNIGSNGASYNYDDLRALFTEVADDIYNKNETYSADEIDEIEQRITNLLNSITAATIAYEEGTVKEALDSLLVPEYITATHLALQSEITATNDIEIKDDSGELVKITGNEPTNLIPNSDLSQANTFWSEWKSGGIPTITWHDGKVTLATPDGSYGVGITKDNFLTVGDKYYIRLDTIIRKGDIILPCFNPALKITTSGTHSITSNAISVLLQISRRSGSSSDEHDFDLDNIFLFNITDLVSRGILPSGLTNAQYKDILDNYFNS